MSDKASPFHAGDRGRSDFMEALYSPDGSRISYVQGQLAADGRDGVFGGPDTRNHVVRADGAEKVRQPWLASWADRQPVPVVP